MMKCCFVLLLTIVSALAFPQPQVEHGAITAPSGFTSQQALPPIDLSKPPIQLPAAIPIKEDPQEPVGAFSHNDGVLQMLQIS